MSDPYGYDGSSVNPDAFVTNRSDSTQETKPDELAWLCENGEVQPSYITVENGMLVWTKDHLKALRLSRRDDAEMIAEICEDVWRVVEHMWPAPPSSSSGEPPEHQHAYHLGNPKCFVCGEVDGQPAPARHICNYVPEKNVIRDEVEPLEGVAPPIPSEPPTRETHCGVAKKIIVKQGETVVLANGGCTALYWHLQSCDACARLRERAAASPKPSGRAKCFALPSGEGDKG